MKDINIAKILLQKRKEKKVTQEELASYIGVSKASVSKWETGISYPDIAFLPQLATYFDISIDELMSYNPQMSKENIRTLRKRLNDSVGNKPLEDIFDECRTLTKKYFSCFPLLMQIGSFMINNIGGLDSEKRTSLLLEAKKLFARIREESGDPSLARLALKMEAFGNLGLGDADGALFLLEDMAQEMLIPADLLISPAYQMKGEMTEAKRVLQVGLYQNVVIQFNYLSNYLMLAIDDTDAFNETIARTEALAKAYDLSHLHPYLYTSLHLTNAIAHAMREETEQALDALDVCAQELIHNGSEVELHGDHYFNLIDTWIDELDAGAQLPRSKDMAKEGIVQAIAAHPAFGSLAGNKRYQTIVNKLDHLID